MRGRNNWDRVRGRLAEWTDQARAFPRLLRGSEAPVQDDRGVAVLVVSFNTLPLIKLLLLTLAERPNPHIRRIVVVENASVDGSKEFLERVPPTVLELISNPGPATHGAGLRFGMDYIQATERTLSSERRCGLVLVLDSDVIVLRDDLTERLRAPFRSAEVAVAGQLQFDVGEAYVHPSCMMVRRSAYEARGIWPFVHHGAPALWSQRSMRAQALRVVDVPVRADDYVVHRGQGTLERLKDFVPSHPNAAGKHPRHYHGNPRGAELWAAAEQRHAQRLRPGGESEAISYIAERLGHRPEADAAQATARSPRSP